MKKFMSFVLTGAIALAGGAYYTSSAPDFSAIAEEDVEYTYGTYENFGYHKYADHVEISSCDKSATEVVIPAEIEGLPVTVIGDRAFDYCLDLESVTIPDSVTVIGEYAFEKCYKLTSITIPASVTEIREWAFDQHLEAITIENPECELYDDSIMWYITLDSDTGIITHVFGGTIYGQPDSTAQAYAEKYGCKFETIGEQPPTEGTEALKGDANGDNSVTIADSVAILQYLANADEYALSEQGLKNADVLGDDGVNTEDALQIQKLDAGVIEKL